MTSWAISHQDQLFELPLRGLVDRQNSKTVFFCSFDSAAYFLTRGNVFSSDSQWGGRINPMFALSRGTRLGLHALVILFGLLLLSPLSPSDVLANPMVMTNTCTTCPCNPIAGLTTPAA